jgi:hypothetical protein
VTDTAAYPENDPRHYTTDLHELLDQLVTNSRANIGKVNDPKAEALLETTAEVCTGLATAFEHYEKRESAWR